MQRCFFAFLLKTGEKLCGCGECQRVKSGQETLNGKIHLLCNESSNGLLLEYDMRRTFVLLPTDLLKNVPPKSKNQLLRLRNTQ